MSEIELGIQRHHMNPEKCENANDVVNVITVKPSHMKQILAGFNRQLEKCIPYIFTKLPGVSFQNIDIALGGLQYFYSRNNSTQETFKILSTINNSLLCGRAIPPATLTDQTLANTIEGKIIPSLFQGFENKLQALKELPIQSNIPPNIGDYKNDLAIELNIDSDSIERSYSLKALDGISSNIFKKLHFFHMQRAVLERDIDDLDVKLRLIKETQNDLNKKITDIEDIELYLKNTIVALTSRKEFIKAYGITDDPAGETTSEQDVMEGNLLRDFLGNNKDNAEKMKFGSDIDTANSTPGSVSVEVMPTLTSTTTSLSRKSSTEITNPHTTRTKRRNFISQSFHNHYPKGASIAKLPKAHDEGVICLDFDFPFGTLATAGFQDPVVKLWDLSKRQQFGELKGHLASINCLQMDPTYNIVITGSKDATVKVWNVDIAIEQFKNDGTNLTPFGNESPCLQTFDSHSDEITSLSFHDNTLVSGSRDKTIRQWDLVSGKSIQSINIGSVLKSNTSSVDLSLNTLSDPPLIGALQCFDAAMATGTKDGVVRLWDLRIGKVVRTLHGHTAPISTLQFDSSLLISGSWDKSVKIWDLGSGGIIDNFIYEKPVCSLSFDPKNITVATGNVNPKIFSRETGEHWDCGDLVETPSTSSFVRYNEGYLVEGRNNGDINVWSI